MKAVSPDNDPENDNNEPEDDNNQPEDVNNQAEIEDNNNEEVATEGNNDEEEPDNSNNVDSDIVMDFGGNTRRVDSPRPPTINPYAAFMDEEFGPRRALE